MLGRIVGSVVEQWLIRLVEPMVRWRIRPNILTLVGLGLNLVAAGLLYRGFFQWAGVLILVANLFDVLDGQLARQTGQATPFGAFLDSSVDRFADLALLMALWLYYSRSHDVLILFILAFAIIGSVMTSYTRARAENVIPSCQVGFFERSERIAVLVLGTLLNRVPQALLILAVCSNITVIHRIIYTWATLRAMQQSDAPARDDTGAAP